MVVRITGISAGDTRLVRQPSRICSGSLDPSTFESSCIEASTQAFVHRHKKVDGYLRSNRVRAVGVQKRRATTCARAEVHLRERLIRPSRRRRQRQDIPDASEARRKRRFTYGWGLGSCPEFACRDCCESASAIVRSRRVSMSTPLSRGITYNTDFPSQTNFLSLSRVAVRAKYIAPLIKK